MVVSLLLSILVPVYATADSEDLERITLEVVLTGGRDPNVNVVQDYGDIVWTEVLTQEFQKEYPNVDVVFRTGTLEQTIVSMIGGVGPDIVNGYGPQFINMGRQGMFIDLLPLLERDGAYEEVKLSYWPPQFGVFQHQGRVFALPQYLNIFAMYYNADMFGYMGVPDPEPRADLNTMDWREFETIARKLTQDRDGDGTPDIWGFSKVLTVTDHLHYWLKAAGSDFYGNEEKTVSILDNPAAVEALEYLQHLRWEAEVMPPPGSPWPWDAWKQGNVAIQEYGSHALVDYLGLQKDGAAKVPFKWNVFPLPIGPSGERYTLAADDGYAINGNTRHPEEAYALLRFLSGPIANEIMAKYVALQPAHRDVAPEYLNIMRELNTQAYDINIHVFTDAGAYAIPEIVYADHVNGETIIKEAYSRIFDQNKPVGPTWFEAIERLNRTMASIPTTKEDVQWESKLATFEDENDLRRWKTENVLLSLSDERVSEGDSALKALFEADVDFPNIRFGILDEEHSTSPEWSSYLFLAFDVWNDHSSDIDIYVKFHQIGGAAHDGNMVTLPSKEWKQIKIPLGFVMLDRTKLECFELWKWKYEEPITIYFDNFRLE